jgi:hypothetical protein
MSKHHTNDKGVVGAENRLGVMVRRNSPTPAGRSGLCNTGWRTMSPSSRRRWVLVSSELYSSCVLSEVEPREQGATLDTHTVSTPLPHGKVTFQQNVTNLVTSFS